MEAIDEPPPPPPSCDECLRDGRFTVAVKWNVADGNAGNGQPIPVSDESVLFWFFSEKNVEVIVKVLDGRSINDHYWVFYGALTNVEYTITVTDTTTGKVAVYHSPQGEICGGADTRTFAAD